MQGGNQQAISKRDSCCKSINKEREQNEEDVQPWHDSTNILHGLGLLIKTNPQMAARQFDKTNYKVPLSVAYHFGTVTKSLPASERIAVFS